MIVQGHIYVEQGTADFNDTQAYESTATINKIELVECLWSEIDEANLKQIEADIFEILQDELNVSEVEDYYWSMITKVDANG